MRAPGFAPFLLALCTVLAAARPALAQQVEYAVKAAFLVRFGPFVEWPASAFGAASSPLNVCVAGADPFGEALDKVAAGQSVHGHPVAVRRLKAGARGEGCHILYLAEGTAPALEAVRGAPVLTVTDASRAPAAQGIVHFVVRDDRVRFEIDDAAAAQNGLAISSKLLALALRVKARSRQGEAR